MEKIASFKIDHTTLQRGVYVSRQDTMSNGEKITTYDIRVKEPNREPAMTPEVAHTIEHLAATYLRNDEEWKDRIVYFGPMGCLTGFYLLMKGDYSTEQIRPLLIETFRFMAEFVGEIPGATAQDCGNWLLHDLKGAKKESEIFLAQTLQG